MHISRESQDVGLNSITPWPQLEGLEVSMVSLIKLKATFEM